MKKIRSETVEEALAQRQAADYQERRTAALRAEWAAEIAREQEALEAERLEYNVYNGWPEPDDW